MNYSGVKLNFQNPKISDGNRAHASGGVRQNKTKKFRHKLKNSNEQLKPITVTAHSKALTVFAHSNTGIVGSNLT
jgi:hypothetical protein